ncbi:Dolichyl-phosphate-mannose-protein mannosyltransferase family [[Actinomadura] parvosata subsp. kistnae]|uniref:ArnT family glycosyltransferase n=1 Tax=[Actinomadura] parvosata TaxID=1955412 RepID=UPI0009AE7D16|nr:glycosyltransferase family 39 protein [Nonomuraea sp. ATCC 55076]SPL87838.1 Dolichyl-phosphate-mannose-protein mannosyltransferase family [Actinomadura parvosata subsp. kistnae]
MLLQTPSPQRTAATAAAATPLPPIAWRATGSVAAAVVATLLLLSPFYGYHRDELYFRLLGQTPAWGYFDQPPLTPLLARLSTALFGDTLVGLRVVPALCAGLLILLGAAITRELGGRRGAQTLAAAGLGTGMFPLVAGHTLLTQSADFVFWTACVLCVLRALLRGDGRWWLAAGAVAGAATFNKHLILLLLTGLATGLLVTVGLAVKGPRAVFADRWFWSGALLAALLASPNVLYQALKGWPQLTMAATLSEPINRVMFVPMLVALLSMGAFAIAVAGWWWLRRRRETRPLAITVLVTVLLGWASGGRADYVAGSVIFAFAAGCVPVATWMEARRARFRTVWCGLLGTSAIGIAVALPLLPLSALSSSPNEVPRESVGWPRFAAQVAAVHRALPPGTVVITANYGEAGALNRFAPGIPVYSGHNELWRQGPPPETARTVVAVGLPPERLRPRFTTCESAGVVDHGTGVANEEQGLPITVCSGPRAPWTSAWADYQHAS